MTSDVRIEQRDAVGWIVMDRPDAHNALSLTMAEELATAVDAVIDDASTRAVVLTGTGPSFNVGADLGELDGEASDGDHIGAVAERLHEAIAGLITARQPVVIGINGTAAGGGFGLALCGDIVVMAESATLSYAYPRIGLSGDGGATALLPGLVGHRRAREIALLDEPIDASTALADGLVTQVVADDELETTLERLATRLAGGPTAAYGTIKRLLREGAHRPFLEHLDEEATALVALTDTDDYRAGLGAFGSDESPTFTGN